MVNVHAFYVEVKKHGTHDQKTHAGGRGGSSSATWSKENNFTFNYDESMKIKNAYEDRYSPTTRYSEGEENEEYNAVDFYVADGYEEMNAYSRGKLEVDSVTGEIIEKSNSQVDNAIANSPDIVGDKNLYRVYSNRVIEDLQPGDTIVDKGFLSTTRVDLTGTSLSSRNTRAGLGSIKESADTVAVIIPSPTKTGKGLIVDAFLPANGNNDMGLIWQKEFEVILPRNTALTFLGFQEGEMERVAVFQRND